MLFLIVFIDLVGFGLVVPLLPFYAERFGATPDVVTVLMATYSIAQFVMAPILGRLSDRLGRRPVLLISLVGSVAAYVVMGSADSLVMLFLGRAIAGACAGNIAAAQAYVADVTTPANRARGMGMIGAAFGLGFIVGPAVGGILAGSDPTVASVAIPFYAAAGLSALAFGLTFFVLRESLAPEARSGVARRSRLEAARRVFGRPALRQTIALSFAVVITFAAWETTYAMWAARQLNWGPQQVGMLFAYFGLLVVMMQGGFVGRLSRVYGEERLIIVGTLSVILGLSCLPLTQDWPMALVGSGLMALGLGITQPSLNSLISRRAGADEQGEIMGASQAAGSLARIIGPIVAGLLFVGLGRHAPYVAGAVIMVVAFFMALRLPGRAAAPDLAAKEAQRS